MTPALRRTARAVIPSGSEESGEVRRHHGPICRDGIRISYSDAGRLAGSDVGWLPPSAGPFAELTLSEAGGLRVTGGSPCPPHF